MTTRHSAALRVAAQAALDGARWPAVLRAAYAQDGRTGRARALMGGLATAIAGTCALAPSAAGGVGSLAARLVPGAAVALAAIGILPRLRRPQAMMAVAAFAWLALLPAALGPPWPWNAAPPARLAAAFGFLCLVLRPPAPVAGAAVLLPLAGAYAGGAAALLPVAAIAALALHALDSAERLRRRAFLLGLRASLMADAQADTAPARARTDWLTGLAGPAAFEARLAACWSMARDAREPLALVLIELETARRAAAAEDRCAADLAVAGTAQALEGELRDGVDCLARVAGDRFAALLPRMLAPEAVRLAHRMRAAATVPLSIGVAAARPEQGGEAEDLLADADEALRRSRAAGCIALADQAPVED